MGAERYFRNLEYRSASDSKAGAEIVKNSLVPLICLDHEKQALITMCILLNALAKAGAEDGGGLPVTGLAFDVGQRCRAERIYDLLRERAIDVAAELLTRHRTRDAKRLADAMARKLDDPDDWATNYLSHHLGEKLIALAVLWGTFNGLPVFDLNTVPDPSDPKKTVLKSREAAPYR
jgi:hypothetical protein